ncbi:MULTISPECIES: WavE lipopolysaccharide synthesis family protein [Erwinia]|uniref:WavE lipopolysaccharide synthesis family protein n=1 Tax=Erwinia TaxID=551 RepID=UPI0010709C47|nr:MULTISPECIES: WavE lipopolysaccharide synthesis family protein [Erwinia]QBR52427.1 WavE lipopolysaccharide synthesis [Erwinia sp. QL-Z3]QEW31533.1 WavE lipopolysaccharide synthesis [Erwinia billingiae]
MRLNEDTPLKLSIVMQGSILDREGNLDNKFVENLSMTSRNFQHAEIIVSTWKCSEIICDVLFHKFPAVKFIFNEDIGPIFKVVDSVKVVSNINRMIFSTISGLKLCTNSVAIKIRTDSFLHNDDVATILENYLFQGIVDNKGDIARDKNFTIFDRHVINCNLFARNPDGHLPFLFHPGDIMFAGLTSDLIRLFSIPLATEEIFQHCRSLMNSCYMKFVPEQYVWTQCIEQVIGKSVFQGNYHRDISDVRNSECYYLNNFIPYSSKALGFTWRKHQDEYYGKGISSVYQTQDWWNLYRKYITHEKQIFDSAYYKRKVVISFMKIYFFVRTRLLSVNFIRNIAYKLFVKRG